MFVIPRITDEAMIQARVKAFFFYLRNSRVIPPV